MQTHVKGRLPSNTRTIFFMSYTKGVNAGFAKGEALRLPRPIRHAQRLIKNVQSFKYA